jgi:PEP-CTERM motif
LLRQPGNQTVPLPPITLTGNPEVGVAGADYIFNMLIKRQGSTVDISAFVAQTDNSSNRDFFVADGYTSVPALGFTFNRVGFLAGAFMQADQVQFHNIDVSVVPEPATACLMVIGGAVLALARRLRS